MYVPNTEIDPCPSGNDSRSLYLYILFCQDEEDNIDNKSFKKKSIDHDKNFVKKVKTVF